MAGRHKGIKLTFEEAFWCAIRREDYWVRIGDSGLWAAWRGEEFLGMARSEAGARNIVVRKFEEVLKEVPR